MIDIYLPSFIFYGAIIAFKSILFKKKINTTKIVWMHRFWLLVYFFMIPHTFDFEQDTRTLEIEQNTTLILDRNVPNKKGKSGKYMCIY